MIKNISNLGDSAIYCDFGSEVNETVNSSVIKYFNYLTILLKENKIDGINNLTPSYNKLIISFDLNITNYKKLKDKIENLEIKTEFKKKIKKLKYQFVVMKSMHMILNYSQKKLIFLKKKY